MYRKRGGFASQEKTGRLAILTLNVTRNRNALFQKEIAVIGAVVAEPAYKLEPWLFLNRTWAANPGSIDQTPGTRFGRAPHTEVDAGTAVHTLETKRPRHGTYYRRETDT